MTEQEWGFAVRRCREAREQWKNADYTAQELRASTEMADAIAALPESLPVAVPVEGTWAWAVEQMWAGKKVRRPIWHAESCLSFDADGFVGFGDGSLDYIPHRQDLRATDWEVVPPPEPAHKPCICGAIPSALAMLTAEREAHEATRRERDVLRELSISRWDQVVKLIDSETALRARVVALEAGLRKTARWLSPSDGRDIPLPRRHLRRDLRARGGAMTDETIGKIDGGKVYQKAMSTPKPDALEESLLDMERPITFSAAELCLEAWRESGDKKHWSTELAGHVADLLRLLTAERESHKALDTDYTQFRDGMYKRVVIEMEKAAALRARVANLEATLSLAVDRAAPLYITEPPWMQTARALLGTDGEAPHGAQT